jgi:hypothetical protein
MVLSMMAESSNCLWIFKRIKTAVRNLIIDMEFPDLFVKMNQLKDKHNRINEQKEGQEPVAKPNSAHQEPGARPGLVQSDSEKELDQL